MTRTFARRFNHFHEVDLFPEPVAYNFGKKLVKVPGLDGSGKMGKSEGENNAIYLADEPEITRKKIMRALTDSGPTEPNSKPPVYIQNLFSLLTLVSEPSVVKHYKSAFAACNIRYGDMKKQLAEDTLNFIAPLRERILDIENDTVLLNRVLREGAEKARESSSKTLTEVRNLWGFKPF
jgi:tryptophanyl-tRNA synthetase